MDILEEEGTDWLLEYMDIDTTVAASISSALSTHVASKDTQPGDVTTPTVADPPDVANPEEEMIPVPDTYAMLPTHPAEGIIPEPDVCVSTRAHPEEEIIPRGSADTASKPEEVIILPPSSPPAQPEEAIILEELSGENRRARTPIRAPAPEVVRPPRRRMEEPRPDGQGRTETVSYVTHRTEARCQAILDIRRGACRECGVRVAGRHLERHCRQHFTRFFCQCGWQSVSRDCVVRHQKKECYAPGHGRTNYEADADSFPRLVQSMGWTPALSFPPCRPHLRPEEEGVRDRPVPDRQAVQRIRPRSPRPPPRLAVDPPPVRVRAIRAPEARDHHTMPYHASATKQEVRRMMEQAETDLYYLKRRFRELEQAEEDNSFQRRRLH